ncbi:extracellular solute-binding protein [Leifsonia sp. H3M29-4]|uniref:extracellular solute-binding protein n=1 Tax=Salinibacterium metalliresistens TaxID=3031321 RepID=UPI0023DC00C6|nr:extracellular solute-binding protein [Salinibacterium metalliresistens]MDF1477980.1 extracellular solute-binding protein [Salinibacterium metalliresistens]
MTTSQFSRRQLLVGAGGVALAGAMASLLAACSPGSVLGGGAPAVVGPGGIELPRYIPWDKVAPDLAAQDNAMSAFFTFPQKLVKGVSAVPGSGGEVTALVNLFASVPPALDQNVFWQELNKRLGVTLNLNMVPDSAYTQKLATVFAGGDIPDIVQIRLNQTRRDQILPALFADLTEYLSGDAIAEYPFLANIPTYAWSTMVQSGGIRAIPTARAPIGQIYFGRQDMLEARGLTLEPANFKEFSEIFAEVTDTKNNVYATANGPGTVGVVQEMNGTPNNWAESGGKFTFGLATDSARQALSDVAQLVKKGYFHPDSFAGSLDFRQLITGGRIVFTRDGYAAWDILAKGNPDASFGALVAPKYDGGGDARHWFGQTTFAFTAIKKSDSKERVRELLRIANWLAAPIGTTEQMFRKYGVEDVNFTLENGGPVAIQGATADLGLPLNYIVDEPPVLGPGPKSRVQAQYDYQLRVGPHLLPDASAGLFSTTDNREGAALKKALVDAQTEVLKGTRGLDYWDEAVATWRTSGGDQIASELEEAFAAANS